jgi:hypothetical protein
MRDHKLSEKTFGRSRSIIGVDEALLLEYKQTLLHGLAICSNPTDAIKRYFKTSQKYSMA